MLKTAFTFLSLLVCIASIIAQTSDFQTPKVWLRADDDNLTSTLWSDISGNENHATTSIINSPEKSYGINYNPVLIFDGENDFWMIPYSPEGVSELTIMTVFHSSDTTERGIWGTREAVSREVLQTTRHSLGPDSVVDYYGNSEKQTVLSTVVQSWTKNETPVEGAYMVVGSSVREDIGKMYFKGAMSEFIVFDRILPFAERLKFETYLALKYGVAQDYGNYISSTQQLLWDVEENKMYAQQIAGLGRDDYFNFYQKQSCSEADTTEFLTISIDNLAATNQENTSKIEDKNFLIWGNNGGTFDTNLEEHGLLAITDRKWLMSATGTSSDKINTELRIDMKQLPTDSTGYWLVIDRGMTDFSIDALEYFVPDSITTDSIAIYSNIVWDTDKSGKDAFAFARIRDMLALARTLEHPTCDNRSAGRMSFEVMGSIAPFNFALESLYSGETWSWNGESGSELQGLRDGEYHLEVRGSDGQVQQRDFWLTIPGGLLIDLGDDQELLPQQVIVLDASINVSDTVVVSYDWESSYGMRSSGKIIEIDEPGVYTAFATRNDGCVFTDKIAISGAEIERFEVFPNIVDVNESFNISVSMVEEGNFTMIISDLRGNVYHEINKEDKIELHFKGELKHSGMYMVVIKTANGLSSQKLIVR